MSKVNIYQVRAVDVESSSRTSKTQVFYLGDKIASLPKNLEPDDRWLFFAYICGPSNSFCDNAKTYTGKKIDNVNDPSKINCSCGADPACGQTLFSTRHLHLHRGYDINHQINLAIERVKDYFSRDPPSLIHKKRHYDEMVVSDSNLEDEPTIQSKLKSIPKDFKLRPFVKNDILPEDIDDELKAKYEDTDFLTIVMPIKCAKMPLLKSDLITSKNKHDRFHPVYKSWLEVLPLHLRIKFAINYLKRLAEFARRYPDNLFVFDDWISSNDRISHSDIKITRHNDDESYHKDRCYLFYPEHTCEHDLEVIRSSEPRNITVTLNDQIRALRQYYDFSFRIPNVSNIVAASPSHKEQSRCWHYLWNSINEIFGETLDETLKDNTSWNYHWQIDFADNIEFTQCQCKCGKSSENITIPKYDLNLKPILFPPTMEQQYQISVAPMDHPREVIVSSYESAAAVHLYYQSKMCRQANQCADNYFLDFSSAQVYNFWNQAIQMYSLAKEFNGCVETIRITVSFRDNIEIIRKTNVEQCN